MRDAYVPGDPSFIAWQGGPPYDRTQREADWHALIGGARARGVVVRRARIISEPVTPYIRFEYDVTDSMNIAAGEQVRWLPRRRASDLALPGNDFWVFDDRLVRFGHFAGDGTGLGHEMTRRPCGRQAVRGGLRGGLGTGHRPSRTTGPPDLPPSC